MQSSDKSATYDVLIRLGACHEAEADPGFKLHGFSYFKFSSLNPLYL